jgi:hypothetical protein
VQLQGLPWSQKTKILLTALFNSTQLLHYYGRWLHQTGLKFRNVDGLPGSIACSQFEVILFIEKIVVHENLSCLLCEHCRPYLPNGLVPENDIRC